MTGFHKFRLGQLGKFGMVMITTGAIASLTACGNSEPKAASPTPVASVSPTPTPSVSVTPTPAASIVPPVATPITVAVESAPKAAAASPAPSPVAPTPRATTNPPATSTSLCKANEGAIINVETKNYRVAICGRGEPEFYVGMEKDDPTKSIRLPLTGFSQGFYEAKNGNTVYVLAKTPKGHFLTVTQGDKELLREVISGWGN